MEKWHQRKHTCFFRCKSKHKAELVEKQCIKLVCFEHRWTVQIVDLKMPAGEYYEAIWKYRFQVKWSQKDYSNTSPLSD